MSMHADLLATYQKVRQIRFRLSNSLLKALDMESGVGLTVHDLWRDETSFLFDIGLSTTARQNFILATRAVPMDRFLTTSGAGLPLSAAAMAQIEKGIERTFDLEAIDFT